MARIHLQKKVDSQFDIQYQSTQYMVYSRMSVLGYGMVHRPEITLDDRTPKKTSTT